jgi:mono/diheme cytochrome c family protein
MRGARHRRNFNFLLNIYGGVLIIFLGTTGCSRDMAEQPSFQPQEGPRLHSPAGSVPRESREALASIPPVTPERVGRGAAIFEINCSHCHGKTALGNGPVASHLVMPPTNLRSDEVRRAPASEIYEVVTKGKALMPAFKGELSAEERWAVAYFVKSFSP